MRTIAPVDGLLFPPFDGFPKEGIDFLKKLKRNNKSFFMGFHDLTVLAKSVLAGELTGKLTKNVVP